MMNKWWITSVVAILMFAMGQSALALDWQLNAGVDLQGGEYKFSTDANTDYPDEYEVPAPLVRFNLAAISDTFVLDGFYSSTKKYVSATVDDGQVPMYVSPVEEVGDGFGYAIAWGADLGYGFNVSGYSITPKIGYRYTEVLAGMGEPAEGGFQSWDNAGLILKELRLGVDLATSLSDKLAVSVSAGIRPVVTAVEVVDEIYYHPDSADNEIEVWRDTWEILNQSNVGYDFGCSVNYQYNADLSLAAGYLFETVEFEESPASGWCWYDGYTFEASRFYAGVSYSF